MRFWKRVKDWLLIAAVVVALLAMVTCSIALDKFRWTL